MFSLHPVPESRYVVHKIRGGDREYQHIVAGFAFKTNVVKQAYGGENSSSAKVIHAGALRSNPMSKMQSRIRSLG